MFTRWSGECQENKGAKTCNEGKTTWHALPNAQLYPDVLFLFCFLLHLGECQTLALYYLEIELCWMDELLWWPPRKLACTWVKLIFPPEMVVIFPNLEIRYTEYSTVILHCSRENRLLTGASRGRDLHLRLVL